MKVAHGLDEFPLQGCTAVTLGVFDGVHLGHQVLLRAVGEQARAHDARAAAILLDPHPELILRGAAPPLLTTVEERIRLIAELGVLDWLVILRFDQARARQPAESFAREVLFKRLRAHAIILGPHARFGTGARGDARLLERLGGELGWQVFTVPASVVGSYEVRSAVVRQLLDAGEVASAAQLLGRWHTVSGRVERGRQRGRRLGFPTANLRPPAGRALPPFGIYAVEATVHDRAVPAAASYGVRPTYGGGDPWIEVHLLTDDPVGDLRGAEMRVGFVERLRDEERFESEEALRVQMARDCDAARAALRAARLPTSTKVLQ